MADRPTTTDDALQHLIGGNARFVGGQPRFAVASKEKLADLSRAAERKMKLVGAVYEIATGRVQFPEP